MQHDILESILRLFYANSVYKSKRIVGKPFPEQFKKIIKSCDREGHCIDIVRQFASRVSVLAVIFSLIAR